MTIHQLYNNLSNPNLFEHNVLIQQAHNLEDNMMQSNLLMVR